MRMVQAHATPGPCSSAVLPPCNHATRRPCVPATVQPCNYATLLRHFCCQVAGAQLKQRYEQLEAVKRRRLLKRGLLLTVPPCCEARPVGGDRPGGTLVVTYHPPPTAHRPPLTSHCPLPTAHGPPPTAHRL